MSTAPPPAPLTPLTVTTTTPQPSGTIKAAWTEAQVKDRMFWFKGFKDNKKGGVIFDDKDVLKKQQGVVKDIMLQLGAQLLSGKLAVRLSLPIRLFEPRSLLERIPDAWAYAPTLLAKAAHATEALDRLQHVMAFVVAGLHFCVGQSKPFNPILGETYQSTFPDGTSVYLEHTGTVKVQFANGSEVQYAMPKFKMHGVVLGERMFEFTGDCHFHDVSSDLRGTLDMDGNSSFLGRSHHDDITGTIVAPATKKGAKPPVVAKLTGSWLNHLHANGVVLWDMATSPVYLHVPVATPLPSDVRFRADLISLKQGDMDEAQRQKIVMEEDQRRDHRLRGHDDGGGNKRHSTPKR
ncbi:hypothetical protein DYB28_002507 [Aphanomyces astaci]|uniref:PH domain-containing protein n=1 Tax=Aphanomyces astaci TaxID=112090 RepID=A0A397A827_APHAT|nr:hypothetical protein DYB36_011973 [Aphanomyces astaci]RHY61493.1 hypothetical protein DYB30_002261 [Aphanomyces astaci]RHY99683.1 hypothetical protein DYB31_006045 [Aphanomyces astaci]RHZ29622.1 hypothetical protein DYB26_005953 [Aphanomyces astaci]RLN99764.1 hypothetical protein DYB28_002507 [Aphanomyces astaci]